MLDSATRAMGRALEQCAAPSPLDVRPADWAEYLRVLDVPAGLLEGADPQSFHVLVAPRDGEGVATAMAFDHDSDCGLYNVTTRRDARRRGLATALTTAHLRHAAARGCRTASLQSTQPAERVYAAVGFRDLGRILEYVPVEGER